MGKLTQTKPIWLIIEPEQDFRFIIIANSIEESMELINELTEGEIKKEQLIFNKIGNSCPSQEYFKEWNGEAFIVTSNYIIF